VSDTHAVGGPLEQARPGARVRRSAAPARMAAFVFLVVAASYLSAAAAGFGFVSDDFMILQRLARTPGVQGALAFFSQPYYDYYRPLGFLSFAVDWSFWRDWPAAYHLTSLALHAANMWLVWALATRLAGPAAGLVAAAIFGLHPANHEAVYWMSARFDLLAACLALGSLLLLQGRSLRCAACALLYLAALLSKESAVAFPVVVFAYAWLIRRESLAVLLRVLGWMGGAALVYTFLRQASGLPPAGGASRLPKLLAFAVLLGLQLALAHPGSAGVRRWMWDRRRPLAAAAASALGALGILAAAWPPAAALRGAFASLGFAAIHLVSPVSPDRWLTPLPWWIGLAGGAAAVGMIGAASRMASGAVPAFLAWFLAAALLPVSSMTEGPRYLYLASVPVAIFAARILITVLRRDSVPVRVLGAVLIAALGGQIAARGRDWVWASGMTAEAAAAIAQAAGPGCRGARIVLATAPVRPRGVHANLNHEALESLAGCAPEGLSTLVRTAYDTPTIDASLREGVLTLRTRRYAGGFLTSTDLRHFVVAIDKAGPTRLTNPLGPFEAVPDGSSLTIRQALSGDDARHFIWFVFSGGELRVLTPGR